ncbi:MAG: NfeD family protein [Gemmatimonadota bacterium]
MLEGDLMTADVIGVVGIVSVSVLALAAMAYVFLRHVPHSRSLSGIMLKDSTSRDTGYLSAPERPELVGRTGVALTDLRPSGTIRLDGERLDVMTEGPWIEAGQEVVILRTEGYLNIVRAAGEQEGEPGEVGPENDGNE